MTGNPLVIDANNVISRAVFATALDDLRAGGVFTGGVYGALGTLRSVVSKRHLRPGPLVAFFDNGVPPKRLKLLPDYKSERKERKELLSDEDREKAFEQIAECYRMWPNLGVLCLCYKQREADDGVAAAVRIYLDQGLKPIVISSDRDLWQMAAWGATIYNPWDDFAVDAENFEEHSNGVPLDRWLLYKAIVGDPSDSIAGVRGCGHKRALALLQEMDFEGEADPQKQLRMLCAATRERLRTDKKAPAYVKGLAAAEDHLSRVLPAIDLWSSFGPRKRLTARLAAPPALDKKAFLRHCRDLHFASILGDPDRTWDPFRRAAKIR